MRAGKVYFADRLAGRLVENEDGFFFTYVPDYLSSTRPIPVSLTLPLSDKPYKSQVLFPFFDGLIPEGWLLEIAEKNWKLDERDRMGLLLACCRDCIGAVSVLEEEQTIEV
ncbi:MAG: HipA N-terminal domain-containing protein [Cyclobacteriaceae bacterium]|jgi:serine/threonine-protein kinase HipA|nr:HipA N-terminal domain-containing protein [Flammeovirgaceae bacterium]